MRKLVFIFCVLCCILLISCQDKAEHAITKSFKEYGEEHFASSHSIKKIIKIEPVDTLATKELVIMAKELAEIAEESEQKRHDLFQSISNDKRFYNLANNKNVPESVKIKTKKSLDNYRDFMNNHGLEYILLSNSLKEVENITDSTVINEYIIKARIKENGVITVRDFYAIVENGDFEKIKIQDHKLTLEEAPETMAQVSKLLDDFCKLHDMHEEYLNEFEKMHAICGTYIK